MKLALASKNSSMRLFAPRMTDLAPSSAIVRESLHYPQYHLPFYEKETLCTC